MRLLNAASYGNVSGYGSRQPTDWEVRIGNVWRRVYCAIYGNIGTCYVRHAGFEFIVDL